jgi:hypothetical protein
MKLSTREQLRQLRDKLDPIIQAAAEDLKVDLRLGSCRFDGSGTATFKLEAAEINPSTGEPLRREAKAYKELCEGYGLKPEYLGQEFKTLDGEAYCVEGLAPRSTKYPVIVRRVSDGKGFKFAARTIDHAFNPLKRFGGQP